MCTMCAVLFVSLYINVYVCLSYCVFKYIYFAPDVPKVWGLQSQPLGLLSISVEQPHIPPSSPPPFLAHRASPHVCLRSRFVAWAATLNVRIFTRLGQFRFTITLRLFRCRWRLLHRSSFCVHLTGPGSSFQNSTLCKAPVCVCVSISLQWL